MTLITERPVTTPPATNAADQVLPGGSYVTLPAGRVPVATEGSYVTVSGDVSAAPATRGSYVTVSGAPVVAGNAVQGSYVTLPATA